MKHSGLLRFRLRSLSFGGQVARNDETQSLANTMEAIQPLISAIAVVISP